MMQTGHMTAPALPYITQEQLVAVLAAHPLEDLRELGYTRRVCRVCRVAPCPPVAQAREEAAELGIDLLAAADEASSLSAPTDDVMPCGCAEGMHHCV